MYVHSLELPHVKDKYSLRGNAGETKASLLKEWFHFIGHAFYTVPNASAQSAV